MTVLMAIGALALGLALLVKAADVFVDAADGLAMRLRWSPTVIGVVVVGFGTSLPELVTSAAAALAGQAELAIGNAAGSNVANLLLILGVAALVAPIGATRQGHGVPAPPHSRGPGRDIAVAALAGVLLVALAVTGELGAVEGAVLLAALGVSLVWQVAASPAQGIAFAPRRSPRVLATRVAVSLAGVIAGAQLLVWSATRIAAELGVPPIVIGSVLVAVGTSLPELATAVASARRRQTELLLGNLIGSNGFNALGVVGAAAIIGAARGTPLVVDEAALAVVAAGAVTTIIVGGWLWRRPRVGRVAGALLVTAYLAAVPLLLAVS